MVICIVLIYMVSTPIVSRMKVFLGYSLLR